MNFNYKLRQFLAKLHNLGRIAFYWIEYLSWLALSTGKLRKKPENVKNVLIIDYGALGDVFSSLMVTNNLAINNPNLNFYLLITDYYISEVKNILNLSNLYFIYPKDLNKHYFNITLDFISYPNINYKYKNLGFILGSNYHSILGSVKSLNKFFLNKKNPPFYRHKIKQEIEIAKMAGLNIKEPLLPVNLKGENKRVEDLLKKNKIREYVIIHPSGRNFAEIYKSGKIPNLAWPLERFSEIADYITEKYKINVIITGSENEKFIGEVLRNKCKNKDRIINFSGKLSIEELVYLTNKAKLVLSIDTATAHISDFVGTPVITLFGPTFPEEVAPIGKNNILLHHPEKCIQDRKKGACYGNKNLCMESITIEEVKNAVDKLLK